MAVKLQLSSEMEDILPGVEVLEQYMDACDLCAHFGRGMTVASKGVLRGTAGRIIQKIFGEK